MLVKFISFIFFIGYGAAEFDIKIQSMENCSSSQRTFYIRECTFSECCMNFSGNVLRPLHKIQVKITFYEDI